MSGQDIIGGCCQRLKASAAALGLAVSGKDFLDVWLLCKTGLVCVTAQRSILLLRGMRITSIF
jgi:hypothetical protein